MEENNKFYTENDIMKVIMQMTEENRIALLSIGFEGLISIANNTESAQNALENCDRYIAGWQRCKRQVLSSKKWQLISSIFGQLSTSILYTPTDCSVGIFLLKRKFHFFHSL